METYCLTGLKFQFSGMESYGTDGADGCITTQMYLMPLAVHFKRCRL